MFKLLSTLAISVFVAQHAWGAVTRNLARPRPRVLITSFDPFGGSSTNGSQIVAQDLKSRLGDDGVEYVVCNLPVVFDRAAKEAKRCLETMNPKPDLVISTGEQPGCDLRIETRAHNNDFSYSADNAGVARSSTHGRPIVRGAAAQENFTFPVEEMFCAARSSNLGASTTFSSSPGGFVCNNTSYLLSRHLRPMGIPYGFIHVPASNCGAARMRDSATAIHRMVKAALRLPGEEIAPATTTEEGCLVHHEGNMKQLLSFVTDGARAAKVACRLEMRRFRNRSPRNEGLPRRSGGVHLRIFREDEYLDEDSSPRQPKRGSVPQPHPQQELDPSAEDNP